MHIVYQDQPPEELVHNLGNAKLARWFWDEYKDRQYREWAAAFADQDRVSRMNAKAQHRPHDCLGECIFRIAKKLRFKIAQVYGWEAVTNEEFCKELIRDNKDKFLFVPVQEKRAILIKTRDLGEPVITPRPAITTTIVPRTTQPSIFPAA